jgi:hypothetical protein
MFNVSIISNDNGSFCFMIVDPEGNPTTGSLPTFTAVSARVEQAMREYRIRQGERAHIEVP